MVNRTNMMLYLEDEIESETISLFIITYIDYMPYLVLVKYLM